MTFLSLWNWLKPLRRQAKLCRRRQRRHERTPQARFVPRLEVLEARTLLSTYTVNALTDTGAGSGLTGDLRYCVSNATSGNDTITFASGLTGAIKLENPLSLNTSVSIQGPGASQLTVERDPAAHAFGILGVGNAATVQISGLTIANGLDVANGATAGAITNRGTLAVSACNVSGNSSDYEFGDLFPTGAIFNTGKLTLSGSTLTGNSGSVCVENDGSLATLIVTDSTISGNSATGIVNRGSATVSSSTLAGNTGSNYGGAIANYGRLTVNNSTLSGNSVFGSGAYATPSLGLSPAGNGQGGGIYMAGGTLSINSSTLVNNQAIGGSTAGFSRTTFGNPTSAGSGYGGGLYVVGGTVTIDHSTLAGNQASGGGHPLGNFPGAGSGGGIYNAAGAGALQMHDSILADDTADGSPDLSGGVASLGYNLIGNTAGGSGFAASDLLNVNPQLGPLQNNGGPTQTMALLAGSPAINAGDPSDNTNPNTPAYDQRGPGFARIVNGIIDIGTFEVQNSGSSQPSNLTGGGVPAAATASRTDRFTILAHNADGSTAIARDASRAAAGTASPTLRMFPSTPPSPTPEDVPREDRLLVSGLDDGTSFLVSKAKGELWRFGADNRAEAVG